MDDRIGQVFVARIEPGGVAQGGIGGISHRAILA
jgi:hypothetical protein